MNALHLCWIIPICIFAGILMAALLRQTEEVRYEQP